MSPTQTKKKSLTIHIETKDIGPHGMPLVYGSTSEKVGSIKGSVHFSSNYDCKGRDIQIIYEARIETHSSANDKKHQHHLNKQIFGHQTISFPLSHPKHHGSTVVAGNYVKEFEIPLLYPTDLNTRKSIESLVSQTSSLYSINYSKSHLPSPASSTRSSPNASSESLPLTLASSDGALVLPSSSYSVKTRIRYTIRAVLQRPFPSLSNFEASQEIWVVNSNTPYFSESPIHSPPSSPIHTFPSSPVCESSPELPEITPKSETILEPLPHSESQAYTTTMKDAWPTMKSGALAVQPINQPGNVKFVVYLCYLCTLALSFGICKRLASS